MRAQRACMASWELEEATRAALARLDGALADRAVVVPNGVDLDRFHPGDAATARREAKPRMRTSRWEGVGMGGKRVYG